MCSEMSESVCTPMAQGLNATAQFRGSRHCLSVIPPPPLSCLRVPQTVSMCTGEAVKTCGGYSPGSHWRSSLSPLTSNPFNVALITPPTHHTPDKS